MYRRSLFSTILLVALLFVFFGITVNQAQAWIGVEGQAIDSTNQDPWTHGGDVYVVNDTNGVIVATTSLNTGANPGYFQVAYGTDDLACGCVGAAPSSGDQMTIYIVFNNGGGGTPGTGSVSYTESPVPVTYNAGYIETGTGPTAISLQGITTTPTSTAPLFAGIFILLLAAASLTIVLRRRRLS